MHFKDFKETKKFLGAEISIIIPFFNSELTLARAVNSVISQSFSDWELILVNDGSTDNSEGIAKEFLKDKRVSYIYQNNKGVSAARNAGASIAKGSWLIFLDSDDQVEPNSILKIIRYFQSDSDISFFQFGIKKIIKEETIIKLPLEGSYFPRLAGSFVIKKTIFEKVGGYDINLKFSENTELFHRIALARYSGVSIPFAILNYLHNPKGGSKNLQNMIDSLTLILDKHSNTLTPHVKHLYHQIIGVNWMRFRNFSQARHHLLNAIKYKPTKMTTWGRFGLACFPPLANIFYSETVKHD